MTETSKIITPQLIVGLGNPEKKYDKTRHNIGFEAVDILAQRWQTKWQENRRFKGQFAEGRSSTGDKIYLLKPSTYMNRSGESIRSVVDWYKLSPESLLVIYDDMDLPLGRLRLRLSGSAGGHNGIKSTISHLGGQNFPRLRIGIGKSQNATVSHVLGRFSPEENKIVTDILKLVVDAMEMSLKEGVEKAMSLYNSRTIAAENQSKNKG
ncbi:aminoacyl-tRNA hydrolase [Lusitaniella coriacea]|uniref:aminoacyl-tRNA hydrolase n=1 Tax=Lusitaniella coriacea TaxID=1983105 RepID=UPI003CF5BD01